MRVGLLLVLIAALAHGAGDDCWAAEDMPQSIEAPHIYLDKSPKIVAYQLRRLTNQQLVSLERHDTDPKYKPVYDAMLTRKGLDRKYRDEAVAALARLEHADPVIELLNAIGAVEPEDKSTPRELIGILMVQKPESLAAQREKIRAMAAEGQTELVKQASYAAIAVADRNPDKVWDLASSKGNLSLLISGIPLINDGQLRGAFYDRVFPLLDKAVDEPAHVAAIEAISSIPGHEEEEFSKLADLVRSGRGVAREAAVRSIRRIPADKWPQDQLDPLAKAAVDLVRQTSADQRTGPATAQLVQLGNDLAGELPDEQGLPIRKQLRDLGVRVVVIRTLREQMQYDTKYFAVQAGKPVQIILENADAMPHNLVITAPGAMQEVAVATGTMPAPTESSTKAYVPDSPKVLEALSLIQPDESGALTFVAPRQPGEYDYVCTFPGHWVRMYGVMIVAADLDAWEKDPRPPLDPLTHQPMQSQKNEATAGSVHEH